MDNTDNIKKELEETDYNSLPVVYCKHCLSLKVMILDDDTDYCDICGSTDTEETDILSWERLYEERYGKPLISIKRNGRD